MKTICRVLVSGLTAGAVFSQAAPVYLGGNGIISFGVAPYGGVPPGFPTYINNNFTGVNDILSSPGGTFLRAFPTIPNNIFSIGPLGTPMWGFQIGGGNGNGPFGAGSATIVGPWVGYAIKDVNPGGGSASYGIASWTANYSEVGGYVGTYGNWLSVAGLLPSVGSAGAVGLRTSITSANPLSPFFGGIDLPQLVLANSRNGPLLYSFVALGGSGAALLVDNALLGTFRGLAVNNNPVAIPAGDLFTVTSTLTFYADPAEFYQLDIPDQALLDAVGVPLPAWAATSTVPEPATWVLLGAGLLWVIALRRRQE